MTIGVVNQHMTHWNQIDRKQNKSDSDKMKINSHVEQRVKGECRINVCVCVDEWLFWMDKWMDGWMEEW